MFRVVMLGSGAALPNPDRFVSCVGIRYGGKVYTFDACEGMQRQMMRFGLSYFKTRAIFISHFHPDHYLGIPGLVYTLQLSGFKDKLSIVGPRGTKRLVRQLLVGKVPSFVEVVEFTKEGKIFEDQDLEFYAFKVRHSRLSHGYILKQKDRLKFYEEKAKALGLRGRLFREIEKRGFVNINGNLIKLEEVTWLKPGVKIVYTGDTTKCKGVVKAAENADLLIHDSTFAESEREEADEKKHATSLDAARVAREAGVRTLILTHISGRYKDPKVLLEGLGEVFPNTTVAYDGMEVLLG